MRLAAYEKAGHAMRRAHIRIACSCDPARRAQTNVTQEETVHDWHWKKEASAKHAGEVGEQLSLNRRNAMNHQQRKRCRTTEKVSRTVFQFSLTATQARRRVSCRGEGIAEEDERSEGCPYRCLLGASRRVIVRQ